MKKLKLSPNFAAICAKLDKDSLTKSTPTRKAGLNKSGVVYTPSKHMQPNIHQEKQTKADAMTPNDKQSKGIWSKPVRAELPGSESGHKARASSAARPGQVAEYQLVQEEVNCEEANGLRLAIHQLRKELKVDLLLIRRMERTV